MKNNKQVNNDIDMELDDSLSMDMDIDFDTYDAPVDLDLTPEEPASDDIDLTADAPAEKEDEPVEEESSKKKKKKGKGSKSEPEEEVIPDKTLIILLDRNIPKFLTYCRGLGLNVHSVFNSVKDIEDFLLFRENVRVVIMETGIGKFNNINNRPDIVNLIGSCDADRSITVFYTDSVLRTDVKHLGRDLYKSVQWHKFDSTMVSIATLLEYKENFVLGDDYQQETDTESNLLHMRGKATKMDDARKPVPKLITPEFIRMNVIDAYDERDSKYKPIEEFVPKS